MAEHASITKAQSVFISYVKEDERVAEALRRTLINAGYRVDTMGSDIQAGARWTARIFDSLESADVVVVLLSKAAMKSLGVIYETAASVAAVEKSSHKRIIPVSLDKDLSPSGLLASYQWIFTSGDPAEVSKAVLDALERGTTLDKAQERAVARRGIEEGFRITDELNRAVYSASESSYAILRSILALGLILAGTVTVIVLLTTGNAPTSVAVSLVGSLIGLLAGIVGYYFGRASGRSR